MLKAVIKKQLLESVSFLFVNKKKGKKNTLGKSLGLAAILFISLISVFLLFWHTSDMLCAPLVEGGLAWVYFAMMGLMAISLSVVGSIFTTMAKLYEAKDNDFLLSMPIPTRVILFARMVSLYLFALFFSSLVFLPAILRYVTLVHPSVTVILGQLLINFLLPFGALAIGCMLGWLIAWVTSKIPSKNLVTAFFSIVFMVGYVFLYSKTNTYLQYVLTHGDALGRNIKNFLYPFYVLGRGCLGVWGAYVAFFLLCLGVFGAIYLLISCTYLRLIIVNKGRKKVEYKERMHKQKSLISTLLKKEVKRFFGNPMVAFNCFMGAFLAVAFPILAACNFDLVRTLSRPDLKGASALILGVIFGVIVGSNTLTSVSVSLEGENIWILQTSPAGGEKALWAKCLFHFIMSAPLTLISGVVLCVMFKLGVWYSALVLLSIVLFAAFFAALGMVVNLKVPKLHWTNEVACVKQSLSSLIGLFASWGVCGLLVGGFFLFGKYMPAWGYFLFGIGALLIATVVLGVWIFKRGVKIFDKLS